MAAAMLFLVMCVTDGSIGFVGQVFICLFTYLLQADNA